MKGKQDQTARPFGVVLAIVVMIIALLSVLAGVHPNGNKPPGTVTAATPGVSSVSTPHDRASDVPSGSSSDPGDVGMGDHHSVPDGGSRLNGQPVTGDPTAHPVYTVKQGDCLWTISQRVYGDANRWRDLARANHLTTPYTIYPGQEVRL